MLQIPSTKLCFMLKTPTIHTIKWAIRAIGAQVFKFLIDLLLKTFHVFEFIFCFSIQIIRYSEVRIKCSVFEISKDRVFKYSSAATLCLCLAACSPSPLLTDLGSRASSGCYKGTDFTIICIKQHKKCRSKKSKE